MQERERLGRDAKYRLFILNLIRQGNDGIGFVFIED